MIPTIDRVRLDASAQLALETGHTMGWSPGAADYLTKLDGWHGSAPIRRGKADRMGSHGTHAERGWKDERLISVSTHHVDVSRAGAAAYVDRLAAFLGDGTAGVFRVSDASQGERWARVYLASGGVDVKWTGGLDVSATVHMVAPDSRKYGVPVYSPATGVPTPGEGLHFPLFTPRLVSSTVDRRNPVINPSFTNDVAGLGKALGGATSNLTWEAGAGSDGKPGYARLTYLTAATSNTSGLNGSGTPTFIPIPPDWVVGDTVTLSAWVKSSRAISVSFGGYFRNGTTAVSSASSGNTALTPNVWTRVTRTIGAIPAGVDNIYFYSYSATGGPFWQAGDVYEMDNVKADKGAVAESYWDGSTDPVQVDADTVWSYSWAGTPNASASLRTVKDYGDTGGALDIGRGAYPGRTALTNTGTAAAGPVFTVTGYVPGFTITDIATGRRLVYTGTVEPGQTLVLDSNDGTVTLDGYAPRGSQLVVADWTMIAPGATSTWLFESAGSTDALMFVEVTPAWW